MNVFKFPSSTSFPSKTSPPLPSPPGPSSSTASNLSSKKPYIFNSSDSYSTSSVEEFSNFDSENETDTDDQFSLAGPFRTDADTPNTYTSLADDYTDTLMHLTKKSATRMPDDNMENHDDDTGHSLSMTQGTTDDDEDNNQYSLSLSKNSTNSQAHKKAIVKAQKYNDRIFMILYSDNLTYGDIKDLVSGLKNTSRAQDILMSYRILSALEKYLDETESWTFNMLDNYDFQGSVRQFDLDIAIVVGSRAEHLLAEIYSWNIPRLKRTITNFSSYSSDDATILTVLVMRILENYSTLEFTLQLALSRSTLIKIHHEMSSLFSKLPGGAENTQYARQERVRNKALVDAYTNFVSSLLNELESTPFESIQQELFQVVRDLRSMFYRFADSKSYKPLEGSIPNPGMDEKQRQPATDNFFSNLSQPSSTSSFNYSNSNTANPNTSNLNSSSLPPLQEEWQEDMYSTSQTNAPASASTSSRNSALFGSFFSNSAAPPASSSKSFANGHRRTFSNSTTATNNSVVSSITEELPSLLQAFEMARRREEYFKQHVQQQQYSSPPETPRNNYSNLASESKSSPETKTPISTAGTSYTPGSPNSTTSQNVDSMATSNYQKRKSGGSMLSMSTSTSSFTSAASGSPSQAHASVIVKPQAPIVEAAAVSEQTVQMKMIQGRMMIKVDGKYVDMQDWAGKANAVTEVNANAQAHHSLNIPQPMPILPSSSNNSLSSILHGPEDKNKINPKLHQDIKPSLSTPQTSDPSPLSSSQSSFGISSIFQPWLKPSSMPPASQSAIKDSKPDSTNNSTGSTLELLKQKKPSLSNSSFTSRNNPSPVSNSSSNASISLPPAPVSASSQAAATASSSWIKNIVLRNAENEFPGAYKNEMDF